MKRALMIGSTVAIAMMIAASAIRVSARTSDTAEIKALEQRLIDGIKAKDAKQIMSCYSDDVFAYDVVPPRQYVGAAAFQKPWQGFLGMFKGPINAEVNDLVINSDGEIAYSRSIQHCLGNDKRGQAVRCDVSHHGCLSQESRQVGDRAGAHLRAPTRRPVVSTR